MRAERDIYDPTFVQGVFDRCSTGYRNWSLIASFGFIQRWRRLCVKRLPLPGTATPVIADLMAGTGEAWPYIINRFPHLRKIHAIDISPGMVEQALDRMQKLPSSRIEVYRRDFLGDEHLAQEFDVVICSFGLQTFNREQQGMIAEKVASILKPGGVVSFIEASVPKNKILALAYMAYLSTVLPAIERLFLKGSQDFAMLGTYTKKFSDCGNFAQCLKNLGFDVGYKSHFFGCATGVTARKRVGTY